LGWVRGSGAGHPAGVQGQSPIAMVRAGGFAPAAGEVLLSEKLSFVVK